MRGIEILQKPSYREISPMRDRPMRGPPVLYSIQKTVFHIVPTFVILASRPSYKSPKGQKISSLCLVTSFRIMGEGRHAIQCDNNDMALKKAITAA